MMDVVVDDVPVSYGMLLSRSRGEKLGGSLQLDMTYATIPIFGGQTRRLCREEKIAYKISDSTSPNLFPIYAKNDDLWNFFSFS